MKVTFRVDCNEETGFGHLSRVINLCRTWMNSGGGREFNFLGNYNAFGKDILESFGFSYTHLDRKDFSDLGLNHLSDSNVVLVDSYLLTQEQLSQLIATEVKVILLDDECKLDYQDVHAVINFRFNAEKLYQYNSKYSFLGIDYFIVKPELVDIRLKNKKRNTSFKLNKILLFFGGGFQDSNFISDIIDRLNVDLKGAEILLLGNQKGVTGEFTPIQPTPDFHEYLQDVDALINGGGVIKYESAFALIPTGSFSTSSLQYEDSLILSDLGVHADFGLIEGNDLEENTEFNAFISEEDVLKNLYLNCCEIYNDSPTLHLTQKLNQIL